MMEHKITLHAGLLAITGMMTACVSLEQAAPPVALLPTANGMASAKLALGRELYITKCAKCHSVEPVKDYSATEWSKIMPEMAEKSKLNAAETEAVTDYVAAALRLADRPR